MLQLTRLESDVLTMLLAGEHPILTQLRDQLPHLSVASREGTGVGFFCDFALDDGAVAASMAALAK